MKSMEDQLLIQGFAWVAKCSHVNLIYYYLQILILNFWSYEHNRCPRLMVTSQIWRCLQISNWNSELDPAIYLIDLYFEMSHQEMKLIQHHILIISKKQVCKHTYIQSILYTHVYIISNNVRHLYISIY